MVLTQLVRLVAEKDGETAEIPSAADRFAVRLDSKPATLTLSESDMTLSLVGGRWCLLLFLRTL